MLVGMILWHIGFYPSPQWFRFYLHSRVVKLVKYVEEKGNISTACLKNTKLKPDWSKCQCVKAFNRTSPFTRDILIKNIYESKVSPISWWREPKNQCKKTFLYNHKQLLREMTRWDWTFVRVCSWILRCRRERHNSKQEPKKRGLCPAQES